MFEAALHPAKISARISESWQQLLPRCAYQKCPGRSAVLNGLMRRGEGIHCNNEAWYCSPECLESALAGEFSRLLLAASAPGQVHRPRLPLGLLLVSRQLISEDALRAALALQQHQGGLLGECLERMGLITQDQITSTVAAQWNCPVFPQHSIQPGLSSLVPRAIAAHYELMPVHVVPSTRTLYVAFATRVDHAVLYAVERMLGYRTEACIVPRSVILASLESAASVSDESELVIGSPLPATDIARMVRGYTQQMRSEAIRYTQCGSYLWTVINGARRNLSAVFPSRPR